jgi:hypothetical protein
MKRTLIAPMLAMTMAASMFPAFSAPMILDGQVSQERVNEMTQAITWNTDLYSAEMEARRQNKMVFWVHMLGSMTGAT